MSDSDCSGNSQNENSVQKPTAKIRSKSYTPGEISLLTSLVKKNKTAVESKKTTFEAINSKNLAWESISLEFNSDPDSCSRTQEQLKKKWENMKAQAKKEVRIDFFVFYCFFNRMKLILDMHPHTP